jgi:GT2 family glycosyltransferase
MSKTLVGICAYGGLPFLRLGLDALAKEDVADVLVIQAKPGDEEMIQALENENCEVIHHEKNLGFAGAINDMLDHAFVHGNYDHLVIMGNDVIPLYGSLNEMILCAETMDYEMVCGSEFDARFLYANYPEARQHFEGESLIVRPSAFESRVWELHKDFREGVEPDTRKDIRNFTLFKRSAFEKVGYADVNFWPNAYFEDNDYGRRCDLLGVSAAGLKQAAFFHWWSRQIHQGDPRPNEVYFNRNRMFYEHKWGGSPGQEKYSTPFNGGPYRLGEIEVPCEMKISSRDHEPACIDYWSKL